MKVTLLLGLFLNCLCQLTCAQTQYHYYYDSTSELHITDGQSGTVNWTSIYQTVYFDGDSLIGNKWYYRQYTLQLTYTSCWMCPIDTDTVLSSPVFVREDSLHKIWYYYPIAAVEVLYDDFSSFLNIGDTFPHSQCPVAIIDSIYLGTLPLKRIRPFENSDSLQATRGIVEGIGSTSSLPCSGAIHGERIVVCYSKGGNTVYLSRTTPCGSFLKPVYTHHYGDSGIRPTHVPQLSSAIPLIISPNPAANEISVKWPESGEFRLEVTDVFGRKLLEAIYSNSQAIVDVSGLSAGRYFVHLTNGGVSRRSQFIKQ